MASLRAGLIEFHTIAVWLIVGIFLGAMLLVLRLSNARYLHPFPGGFALRRPWEVNVLFVLISLMGLLGPLALVGGNLRFHAVLRRETWIEIGVFVGICWLGAAFLIWLSGPQEIAVDEKQRTYRRSEGWPPFRRVSAGSLSDLSGVWIEPNTNADKYWVCVGWQGKRGSMVVEQFSSSLEGAQYFANELAATLGIPCLDGDPSAPPLPYRVPADQQRPQWIEQDGHTVSFQEWAEAQESEQEKINDTDFGTPC